MQPRGIKHNPAPRTVVTVSKFVISEDMNEQMEGNINIDTSQLPNTFQTKSSFPPNSDERNIGKENEVSARQEIAHKLKSVHNYSDATNFDPSKKVITQKFSQESEPESEPEPEPEEVSEVEEDTLVPETQIISNLNATARDTEPTATISKPNLDLDTEMEDMLAYLNDESVDKSSLKDKPAREEGGRDSIEESANESALYQFADRFSELVISEALNHRKMHYDPAVKEFYEANDSVPDVFAMSLDSTHSSLNSFNADNHNYLSEPENSSKKERMQSVAEENEASEEPTQSSSETEKNLQNEKIDVEFIENSEAIVQNESEDVPESNSTSGTVLENIEDHLESDVVIENGSESSFVNEKMNEASTAHLVAEQSVVDDSEIHLETEDQETLSPETADSSTNKNSDEFPDEGSQSEASVNNEEVLENVEHVEDECTVVDAVNENTDSSIEENDEENTENRPRFDSSIATIHVLHESDSDESATPRRERRLTESELQLGKTSPYWIPDSECPNCMLCNTRFTIITRRHHCRACGRVLCGSCCNEKAFLEYLQEEGKKLQAVRVCKPCSAMLARIETHEQDEQRRRESIASENGLSGDETISSIPAASTSIPRGVLKTKPTVHVNEEDGASTSSQAHSTSGNVSDSSRRSVMFRDGVRPGAPADEGNPEEERSTALKPKKKSRKRTSVVRRIAELRMEDELACALPKEGITKLLIVKPDCEHPKFEDASTVLETLCNFSVVTVVLKKNLNCTVQIFNNPNFGLVWAVSTQGFAQIGLDELMFSWTLNDQEKQKVDAEEPELDEKSALVVLPLPVLHRISLIYTQSTEHEYAGVRKVENRLMRVHSVTDPTYPLTKHIMFFRPTVQVGLKNMRIPTNPFLIACFLHDDELNWATALPNRLLYKLGEKFNVFPTPFVNSIGRESTYSTDVSGTVLKVFTDFRSWSYRMRHISGCTVSLTNDKTVIRIPKSAIKELKDVLNFSRSMVAWSCDLHCEDDSVLVCEETDPGLYSTQVFAKNIGQRESTSASFVILDGGSKVSSLQVNVVEDGVAVRLQSERLETILNAINDGNDAVESSKDMEFRVEFVEDGNWICTDSDYYPKSQIDGLYLINKFQYGLSLERALTQVLQVQGINDYGIRMSHVYNLGDGRLQPEEEPKIYGMIEIAARECVAMLEPHIQHLICAGIGSVSIRLFVSPYEFEYDVSKWLGLEAENDKYKQSLDQLIPMLYNMVEYVPNGFEVEFVLSIVSTRALPI